MAIMPLAEIPKAVRGRRYVVFELAYEQADSGHTLHACECGRANCRDIQCAQCWREVLAELDQQEPETTAQTCELRWCKSNQPATVSVTENIGDGAWLVWICATCADAIGVVNGKDLPKADVVRKRLALRYRQ